MTPGSNFSQLGDLLWRNRPTKHILSGRWGMTRWSTMFTLNVFVIDGRLKKKKQLMSRLKFTEVAQKTEIVSPSANDCVAQSWFHLRPCSCSCVVSVQHKTWRTPQQSAAALWTARIHMPPLKICLDCRSAHLRAATWKWSLPCPETEHTQVWVRHHPRTPHCT